MNLGLILLLSYLSPLLIIQVLMLVAETKFTPRIRHESSIISCIPIMNLVFIIIFIGIATNFLLNRKDKSGRY